jgi:hypothetical protein
VNNKNRGVRLCHRRFTGYGPLTGNGRRPRSQGQFAPSTTPTPVCVASQSSVVAVLGTVHPAVSGPGRSVQALAGIPASAAPVVSHPALVIRVAGSTPPECRARSSCGKPCRRSVPGRRPVGAFGVDRVDDLLGELSGGAGHRVPATGRPDMTDRVSHSQGRREMRCAAEPNTSRINGGLRRHGALRMCTSRRITRSGAVARSVGGAAARCFPRCGSSLDNMWHAVRVSAG